MAAKKIKSLESLTLQERAQCLSLYAKKQRSLVDSGSINNAEAVKKILRHASGLSGSNKDTFAKLVGNVLVDPSATPEFIKKSLAIDKADLSKYYVGFGDSGFRDTLRDKTGNLVHHMGFYFIAGYKLASIGGDFGAGISMGGVMMHEFDPYVNMCLKSGKNGKTEVDLEPLKKLLTSGEGLNPDTVPDLNSGAMGILLGKKFAGERNSLEKVDTLWDTYTVGNRQISRQDLNKLLDN